MIDYASQSSQDYNNSYSDPYLTMPHHFNSGGVNYIYNNGQIQYSTVTGSCPAYLTNYIPSQNDSANTLFAPTIPSMTAAYTTPSSRVAVVPSQSRVPGQAFYNHNLSAQSTSSYSRTATGQDFNAMVDTESQDSVNEATMLSEHVSPPLEGYPNVKEFDDLMRGYVQGLSPKKQDKALIHARRAANIRTVLIDKKTTSVESAQFRFWVKKMFTLQPTDPKIPDRKKKICHEGKPVAVREKLFKILTRAHKQCQHGGRDKTSAQVRRIYSWVPKELISRFVKICPTCQIRRGISRNSPTESEKSPETYMDHVSPETISPSQSRRESIATKSSSSIVSSPVPLTGFSSTFQQQNRWMAPVQSSHAIYDRTNNIDRSATMIDDYSAHDSMNVMDHNSFDSGTSNIASNRMSYSRNMNNGTSSGPGYFSNPVHSIQRQSLAHQGYGIKLERHYS